MRPFLSFNGVNYVNPSQIELARPPSANEPGPIVGRAGNGPHDVQYDCELLSPGDQVYALKGYQPSFRLAVRSSNGIVFFEVGENPQASAGEWNAYRGTYRWQKLPNAGHSALDDARAALDLIQQMAAGAQREKNQEKTHE